MKLFFFCENSFYICLFFCRRRELVIANCDSSNRRFVLCKRFEKFCYRKNVESEKLDFEIGELEMIVERARKFGVLLETDFVQHFLLH